MKAFGGRDAAGRQIGVILEIATVAHARSRCCRHGRWAMTHYDKRYEAWRRQDASAWAYCAVRRRSPAQACGHGANAAAHEGASYMQGQAVALVGFSGAGTRAV